MKQAGLNDTWVIGVYIFYNLVYALSAFPLGILADRIGVRTVFICGTALFIVVYGGMGVSHQLVLFLILFFLYGIYAAATEGISKAWITTITNKESTATAIGLFTGLQKYLLITGQHIRRINMVLFRCWHHILYFSRCNCNRTSIYNTLHKISYNRTCSLQKVTLMF